MRFALLMTLFALSACSVALDFDKDTDLDSSVDAASDTQARDTGGTTDEGVTDQGGMDIPTDPGREDVGSEDVGSADVGIDNGPSDAMSDAGSCELSGPDCVTCASLPNCSADDIEFLCDGIRLFSGTGHASLELIVTSCDGMGTQRTMEFELETREPFSWKTDSLGLYPGCNTIQFLAAEKIIFTCNTPRPYSGP